MDDFIETITRTSIFSGLSREDLARVAGKLDEIRVAAGTVIIRQAEPGDALYVVQTGAVDVLQEDEAGHVERIAMLGPRECFGEIALFTGAPRSASVVALVETSLLRMSKDACEQLVAQCPPFSLHVCRLLGQRLVERGRELATSLIGRDVVLDDLFETQAPLTRQLLLRASIPETLTPDSLAAILDEPGDLGKLAERYPRLLSVRRRWLYALPALAAGAVVWYLPPPPPLEAAGMRFLATLTAAVALWSPNVFDDFVVALGLLLSWIVAGVVRPEVALSGFTKPSWFLFIGALGIGAGVTRSGLLYRAALAMVRRVTPSYPRYTAILVVAGLLATPALPSMIGRMAVVAPVSWAIAESVGFAPRSAGAAGIVLASFLGFSLLGFVFLTGSTGGLLGWNALPESARAEFGWTAWAVAAAPAGFVTIVGLWLAIHLLFRLPPDGGVRVSRERFQAQLEILGAFTRREAFGLAVLLLALAGWMTTPLHGIGEAWVALGALLLFVLGGVLDRGSLRTNVDLGFLLFLGVVSSLSGVAGAVKADRWLMSLVAPVLDMAAVSSVSLLLAVALVTIAVRLVLNKFAAIILLTLALTPLGQQLGVHPGVILLVILLNLDVWFFPYQLDVYQIAYFGTGEQGFSHRQGRRFMGAKLVVSLAAVAASVPWWRALGLVR